MKTVGTVRPPMREKKMSQGQKPLQQACVSRKQDALLTGSTLPCMAFGLSGHQAGASPLSLSDSEGSAFLVTGREEFLNGHHLQKEVKVFHFNQ